MFANTRSDIFMWHQFARSFDLRALGLSFYLVWGFLLTHILYNWQNLAVPSDSFKKCLMNCNVALKHLKEIGVPLCDEDGVSIVADDLVNRDRELTLSLLWNIFVHLQVCSTTQGFRVWKLGRFLKSLLRSCLGIGHELALRTYIENLD